MFVLPKNETKKQYCRRCWAFLRTDIDSTVLKNENSTTKFKMFVPPQNEIKKKIPADTGHYLRTEIDSPDFKN